MRLRVWVQAHLSVGSDVEVWLPAEHDTARIIRHRDGNDNSTLLLGKKLGYTFNNRNFHNVSLGQGQEVVAEAALDLAAKKGHWVILQVRAP